MPDRPDPTRLPAAPAPPVSAAAPAPRFGAGDSVRACAALAVVVYHCVYLATYFGGTLQAVRPRPAPLGPLFNNLDLGFSVFFALSGYLIARPFVRAALGGSAGPDLLRYARNRALRIVPLFWAVTTTVLAVHLVAGDAWAGVIRHDGWGAVSAIYGFGQNVRGSLTSILLGPAWTLDIEVVFYVAVPIAWLALRPRAPTRAGVPRIAALCGLLVAASLAFRSVAPHTAGWARAFPAWMGGFAPGIALAALEQVAPAWLARRPRAGRLVGPLGAALAVACFVAYHLAAPRRFGFDPANPPVRGLLAAAFGGAVLAVPLVRQWRSGPQGWFAASPSLRWLGARSYGLYLWHEAVAIAFLGVVAPIHGLEQRRLALLVLTLPVSVGLAAASYRWVERPFLSLRREPPPRVGAAAAP